MHDKRPDLVEKFSKILNLSKGVVITTKNFPDPYRNNLPLASANENYTFHLKAWGGNGNYTWESYTDPLAGCKNDSFPNWIEMKKFEKNGLISGIPQWESKEKVMSWNFCVKVSDSSKSPHPQKTTPQSFIKLLNFTAVNEQFN